MIEYACINARKSFERNYIIARDQKRDEHGVSFQSSPKINRMLIARLICIQWKFRTIYSLAIEVFTKVFTCYKVINAFKRKNSWTDPFRKRSTSFASIFPKLHKIKHGAVTRPDSYPQFPRRLGPHWGVHTRKKWNTCIFRVSLRC